MSQLFVHCFFLFLFLALSFGANWFSIEHHDSGNSRRLLAEDELVPVTTISFSDGHSVTKYEQVINQIPVYDSIATGTDKDHIVYSHLANIGSDLDGITFKLTGKEALSKIKENRGEQDAQVQNEQSKQYILCPSSDTNPNINTAKLVYLASYIIETENKVEIPTCFVDGVTGDIEECWDNLQDRDATGPGGNTKVGQRNHNGGAYAYLQVDNNCRMTTSKADTRNMNHARSGSGVIFQISPCPLLPTRPHNTFKTINGAFSPINDVHYGMHVTYDMYQRYLGVPPLRFKLRARVHYGTSYENAFWDGTQLTFGDGASRFHPLTSLDVVSHEAAHGFTQQNSNLAYRDMSGGMNEAFSDMSGEAAEYFEKGTNDWMVGQEVWKGAQNTALRYMFDPPRDGRSIDHARNYRPGMGVHFSSGVFNKAFYLLSRMRGWNTSKSFITFARANQLYWSQRSTFDQGGCGVRRAAQDLNHNVADVTNAFAQVGVSTSCLAPTPFPTPTPRIQPIRLRGGTSSAGRVEVFYNSRWGTVCDDGWSITDCRVVCRQLSLGSALSAPCCARYGQGTGQIWMDDVACTGSEAALSLCRFGGWGRHNCAHSEDASCVCSRGGTTTSPPIKPIRLRGGTSTAGRVEIFHNGFWGTVCDDGWSITDCRVVCRQLGLGSPVSAPCCARYGQGSGNIWMDDVACTGSERALSLCPFPGWGRHNCGHSEDASCVCSGTARPTPSPVPPGCQARCSQISVSYNVWNNVARGIEVSSYTNDELQWIGCASHGCTPQNFYCRDTSSSIQFGTTSSNTVLTALLGPRRMPMFSVCCDRFRPRGVCNIDSTSVTLRKLCNQLGYVNYQFGLTLVGACPEVQWNGTRWWSDWRRDNRHSYFIRCYGPSPSCAPTSAPVVRPTRRPTRIRTRPPIPPEVRPWVFVNEMKTFKEAEAHCRSLCKNGHLISINSQKENRQVRRFVLYESEMNEVQFWAGGFKIHDFSTMNVYREWKWTDGSKWCYSDWKEGRPQKQMRSKSCTLVTASTNRKHNGWVDKRCDKRAPFVCSTDEKTHYHYHRHYYWHKHKHSHGYRDDDYYTK